MHQRVCLVSLSPFLRIRDGISLTIVSANQLIMAIRGDVPLYLMHATAIQVSLSFAKQQEQMSHTVKILFSERLHALLKQALCQINVEFTFRILIALMLQPLIQGINHIHIKSTLLIPSVLLVRLEPSPFPVICKVDAIPMSAALQASTLL